ncbi:ATP-grasp domain-containing protein [Aerococcus sp. UMB10185]|uniref:carboxylate--amine ligase n=1 Tax=Aerococcus sp. UMB10185 TaxID=3046357 RepID=UPI00254B0C18|nr:ATP-grasp domain-containing protein [Aerococcus sp. UMB10185]MDK6234041.1 ATP-grasp domain-containing protein [Aerococcus sp. UMB10185]
MSNLQAFVPVLFLGNKGAYSIARAFHEQYGIKTELNVTMDAGPVAHSKIVNKHIYPDLTDNLREHFIEVRDRVERDYPEAAKIVLASEDTFTEHLITHRDIFEEAGWTVPYVDLATLEEATDKAKFYAKCEEVGVPYPHTWQVTGDQLPSEAKGKLVVKPAITPSYQVLHFEGKRKIYFCDDPKEAQTAIKLMRQGGYLDPIIVQDFIEGADTDQAVVTAYRSPHDKQIKLTAFGRVMVEDRSASAAGNHLAILSENGHEEVYRHVEALMTAYDFTGYANFDLIYDHDQEAFVFFELNPRLGLSNYYVTAGGQNPVYYYIEDYLFGRPVPDSFEAIPALFTVLPRGLVKRRLQGTSYADQVKGLYQEGQVFNPLAYPYDNHWRRKLYVKASELNYYRKFKETGQL